MPTPLLQTKLYIPPVRPELVSRQRLIEQLNAGLHRKLTLISAPAGFGKTTLLSEWGAGCGRPVAWLSLDEGDNDSAQFWAYLIAALQTIHEGIGEATLAALQSPQPPSVEPLLTDLINEIAGLADSFTLALDDFHVITDQQVNDGITFLLDNLPPQIHLVLSSRADPPWPLARLRARREMTELRTSDLRFTSQEAAAFLNEAMRLDLSPEDVAALEDRTEGWIAGLQMAALSMRGQTAERVADFIVAFSGSHRFILDYLVEEILDRQSSDTQEFLLKTCILERMTAPLCDAITDSSDSQAILTQLEQANLFLVPLDDERRWYRYHHLFADLLRYHLHQAQPDLAPTLHHRASAWYEQNRLVTEAVSHAFAAGDMEQVARLIEGNALSMMGHGKLTTIVKWLDALPDEMVRSRPWLSIARAWTLLYGGQLAAVEPLLQDAENSLRDIERDRVAHIRGHIAAIRAEAAYVRGEMSDAATLAHEALECLPPDDSMARGFAAAHLAYALYWSGDLAAADMALADAYAIARTTGDSHIAVMVLCDLATVRIDRGQLHGAVTAINSALQLADQYAGRGGQLPPSTGHAHTYMARVLLEWNDLESALRHARKGNELCRLWRQPETLTSSYYSLARVLQASGDAKGALDAIQEAKQLATALSPWIAARVSAWEALVRLVDGDLSAADRWRRESGLSADDQPGFQQRFLYRTLARVLTAIGREQSNALLLDKAAGLLSRLFEEAEAAGAIGYAIEVLVLKAITLQAQGKMDQALVPLEHALSLAEPEGYVRAFIDEGAPMGELLRQAAARGIKLDYVSA
ncbi:MAG TPA: helix-turn-helix transcriptional regulator, partial [Thermoflexia bacterium]|nr:helix-turn-helix transcriptional regulator [Thermoflexia bacterium]